MPHVKIDAPAKLNLHLQIGDRRPDGFHEIQSLFLALAFGDTLFMETVPNQGDAPLLQIHTDGQFEGYKPFRDANAALSPEKNIIFKAVSLFRSRTGYDKGLKVTVEKRIPLGGGLGGGSSDAAAALLALNRLAAPGDSANDGCGLLDKTTLMEVGASLGSDIPFFLSSTSAAWVGGRGERVQPVLLPESVCGLCVVLVNPGFPSSTAEAFRLLDAYRQTAIFSQDLHDFPHHQTEYVQCFSGSPRNWPFQNDFLPVFRAKYQENVPAGELFTCYQQIISDFQGLGADFAGLSGSGSTCFGVFSRRENAELAKKTLLERWPFVTVTFPLARCIIVCYNNG